MSLAELLENFHFLRPVWGLLLLPPVAALAIQWRRTQREQAWDDIIAPHLLAALRLRQFRHRLFSPVNVAATLMVLMAFIAMGPSWRQQPSPLAKDEAALVVLLDTSPSMQAEDIQPSRLVRARQKVADLLALRAGSRTALVVYAGSAHTVLDLTDDGDILRQYLTAIQPDIMPRGGKFAEYALPMADRIIGDSTAPTTLLLMSDGVSGATIDAFREWFDQRPHQLLVLGVGTENPGGNAAPLEARSLRELARETGGRYIELTVDDADVRAVQRRVDAHYVITDDSAVPWLDSGYWLVFPCLALFVLWFRRGWTLQWCLAGCLVLGTPGQARADDGHWFMDLWLTPDQQGRLLMDRGDYGEAANRFQDPFWKGFAYYYAEEFDLAAEYFSRIDSPEARFNQANALAHGEHYLRAVAIFRELLQADPGNEIAKRNRDIVQELIDAIDAMSESQVEEGLGSRELGDDEPRRADGAQRMVLQQDREQFSAEDILQDEKISEMWMRSVQRDPSHFLSVKFSMQLEQRRGAPR
jgi:Ca-activated chloride channel family protein